MTLQKQVFPYVFSSGVDTGSDPKLLQVGLLKLENGVFDRQGAISKRSGQATCSGTYNERSMAVYQDRPILLGDNLHTFNGVTTASGGCGFDRVASAHCLDIESAPLTLSTGYHYYYADTVEAANVRVVAYSQKTATGGQWSAKVTVFHRYSGVLISDYTVPDSSSGSTQIYLKCLTVKGAIYVVYSLAAGALGYFTVNSTTGVIGARNDLTSGGTWSPCALDAIELDSPSAAMAIAYVEDTTRDVVVLTVVNGTVTSTSTMTVAGNGGPLSLFKNGTSQFVVLYTDVSSTPQVCWAMGMNESGSLLWTEQLMTFASVGDSIWNIAGVRLSSTDGRIYISWTPNGSLQTQIASCVLNLTTRTISSATNAWALRAQVTSRPFVQDNGRAAFLGYWWNPTSDVLQRQFYVLDQDALVLGKAKTGKGVVPSAPLGHLSTVTKDEDGRFFTSCSASVDQKTTGLWSLAIERKTTGIDWASTEDLLCIANANPYAFDGLTVFEQGFLEYPEELNVTLGGATTMTAGTYSYKACFEWWDRNGRRWQSSPSLAGTVVNPGGVAMVVVVPTLSNTRRENVRIVLYRTAANGTVYYRVADQANDRSAYTVSFTDTTTDANLTDEEQLYASGQAGDTVENVQPPPYRICEVWQNRLFVVDRDNENWRIVYSKDIARGIGLEFSDLHTLAVPPEWGAITALVGVGDRLFIFKENQIYATGGEGLNSALGGRPYESPWLVSSSLGCANNHSIVRVPQGVIFLSKSGLYLITRNEQLTAIGDRVKYFTDEHEITSANIVADKSYALLTTDTGNAVSYNYKYDQWSTFTNYTASDGVVADGLVYRVTSSGTVSGERRDLFTDSGSHIPLTVETNWVNFAGPLEVKRVYKVLLLGQALNQHILETRYQFDYDPAWVDSQSFNVGDNLGKYFDYQAYYGTGLSTDYVDTAYIVETAPSRQRCSTFRLRISDTVTESVIGEALSLSSMLVVAGLKPGGRRPGPSGQSGDYQSFGNSRFGT